MDVKNQSKENKNSDISKTPKARKSVDTNFKTVTEIIEIVEKYTYLCTRLTPTGNFILAQ